MDLGVVQETAPVLREDRGGVAWLRLNRPERGNLLSQAMLAALHQAVREAADDASARVLVLAAAGRIFCAGHDLREIRGHADPASQQALFAQCSALMLAIERLEKPVIACVQGAAVAGGCQLAAACDLAYAAAGARFGLSGINLGLFCSTPAVPVSRLVAPRHALELLLTGRLIDADEAARIGLVNEAVAAERLEERVQEVAAAIAAKLPEAIGLGKTLFRRQLGQDTSAAYAMAERTMVDNLALAATQGCIDAFLDRAPAR